MTSERRIKEGWLLLILASIQFTDVLDFMIMTLMGPQIIQVFSISDSQFAWLISAYSFAGGASALVASLYVERFDRKRLLLILYAMFGLSSFATAFAPSYAALVTARVFSGACGGVILVLMQTIIGDTVPFERRGKAMGILMASYPVCTVIGVPLSLFLANKFGWQTPYLLLAGCCAVLWIIASLALPTLRDHMQITSNQSPLQLIKQVLAESNHQITLLFSALLMFAGFTIIPFVTIFTTANLKFTMEQVPLIYFVGGIATLITTPLFFMMTDRWGKVPSFRLLSLLWIFPALGFAMLPVVPFGIMLAVSTALFVTMNGRMIAGLAMVNSAGNPALLGTFMSVNVCIQSAAIGIGSVVGGSIVGRDAQGALTHYALSAGVGVLACILTILIASKLYLHGSQLKSGSA
jgi:predicted MFS family arabinose efflux permease